VAGTVSGWQWQDDWSGSRGGARAWIPGRMRVRRGSAHDQCGSSVALFLSSISVMGN